ncbi:transmembrane BAX inhibitor domain-containing protein-containing protein 4 [Magnaporthiopsis poae ATCC 64411]|uniref:Transmembrane BAX inhibitor domain-containing protein-containing protein 4 n=1 Tax=Magnaporthiopsis poae (strain ATCC 64411 / 73-15) TaxID=644358 RepID=A0A0C4DQ32_MAGP6|nr:transmembrane BAX inhibitor domain-containing protein-containing protein 4 [Magnaporthiopsis poae ATCC 64411]
MTSKSNGNAGPNKTKNGVGRKPCAHVIRGAANIPAPLLVPPTPAGDGMTLSPSRCFEFTNGRRRLVAVFISIHFGGSVSEATIDIRHQFIRKVYAILTAQLLLTGGVSALGFLSSAYRDWTRAHPGVLWLSLFGAMGMMFLTYWKRKTYPTNLLFLAGFTLLEAYTVSVVVTFYKSSVVLSAVLLTAGIFVFLTAFACQTKYDFTSWMPYLFGALWGLVLFGFVAVFLPYNSTADLIYGGLAALIFSGYILVDTQLIMRHHHVEEEIAAAISLYLDIINLFLAILRILNNQSQN